MEIDPRTVQLKVGSSTTSRSSTSTSRKHCPALHNAVLTGDISLVEQILNAGENPDLNDKWNSTPIMSLLMQHGLQDTRCIFQNRNPIRRNLAMDCREEDAERVAATSLSLNLFLQYGANPNARSNGGKTALHYATCDGLYEAAKVLLNAGATIDAQDKDGRSPLYCAVQERSLLVTNLLLEHRASIDLQDKNNVSPLSLVIQKGYVDMMQIFLNHHALVAIRERLDFAGEMLLQAVEAKSTDIVRFLVKTGYVSLIYQNESGETAMHRAVAQRNTEMMETLRSLDPNCQTMRIVTSRGESCLHFAARFASERELELLLQFLGQPDVNDLNELDSSGATPLLVAATTTEARCFRDDNLTMFVNRQAKMRLLLSHGAMLFCTEAIPGRSPLCLSAQNSGILLCTQVRQCITQWLVECQDECDEFLQDFCSKWISNILASSEDTALLKVISVLNLSVCAGYHTEVLPLLLMLPQETTTISAFLHSLDAFKSTSDGLQFECLVRELRASWGR